MRRVALLSASLLFVACVKSENSTPDTTAALAPAAEPAPAPAAAAPIALSSVAGKYSFAGKNEKGDSTLVTYDLTATGDTAGWSLKFPNRSDVIPQRVTLVDADSIVLEAGPYESNIQRGVKVRTRTVYHVQDGKLMGRTVARYDTKGPDTLRIILSEGVKK
ncbi:MAG TPA: hypothetical protein VM099_15055 [Gemmatimonadaceae bacterium]|nr:hypothetical protein [Gemmatimonadaceae bacterium]